MEDVYSWLILLHYDTHFSIPNSNYAKVFIVGKTAGKQTLSSIAGGSVNWYNIYEVNLAVSLKIANTQTFDADNQPSKTWSNSHISMCLKWHAKKVTQCGGVYNSKILETT